MLYLVFYILSFLDLWGSLGISGKNTFIKKHILQKQESRQAVRMWT